MFDIQDYEYDLPEELIAQVPAEKRDHARLLVVDRSEGSFSNRHFYELPRLLKSGDLLVVNNTRVIPARLFGRKKSGGRIEILVLEHADSQDQKSNTRWCLSKSAKRLKKGSRLEFGQDVSGFVEDVGQDGLTRIRFQRPSSANSKPMEKLPPFSKSPQPMEKTLFDKTMSSMSCSNCSLWMPLNVRLINSMSLFLTFSREGISICSAKMFSS